MILGPLVGLSLVISVAVDSGPQSSPGRARTSMSDQQKNQMMQPLVRSATECILRVVTADPRIEASVRAADVRDLIVESMPTCADAMRKMIDEHDELYGQGSGETFFMGPYLDMLPTLVFKSVKNTAQ
jgi:hypothetical protein